MGFATMWYVRPAKAQKACAYVQSDQSLCWSLEYAMTVNQLTKQYLESLSLKEGSTGSSEYTCQNAILLKISYRGLFLNSSDWLEHLAMLQTSTLTIKF